MENTYYSGKWYLTVSDESPMCENGEIYCMLDLITEKNSYWGCPIDQQGSVEKLLRVLKGWVEIDKRPEFQILKEVNKDRIKMQADFINVLSSLYNK